MKNHDDTYFNPDGSIKRLPRIIETLPDGTRVLENGIKLRPSCVDFGGERGVVRLDSLSKQERDDWEKRAMKRVGRCVSDFEAAQVTGAFNYK